MAATRGGESETPRPDGGLEKVLPAGDLTALQERISRDRGHPLLVNFWATWCLPCVREVPTLNAMAEDLGPLGTRFLAVSLDPLVYPELDEARGKVVQMIDDKSFRLPMFLYDGDQEALEQMFELPAGLPHTILMGADGTILDRVEGLLHPGEVERLTGKIRDSLRKLEG